MRDFEKGSILNRKLGTLTRIEENDDRTVVDSAWSESCMMIHFGFFAVETTSFITRKLYKLLITLFYRGTAGRLVH
jgi:hypothetical protein